jgi:hypothetical protein
MSNDMWRYLIAGFLVLHGIGHVGGPWMFVRSWLSPQLIESPLKWAFVVIWLAAMIAFVAAGILMLQHQAAWRMIALAASIVSLVVSALYIQGAPFNAAAADVVILAALLVFQWPTAEMIGS